MKDILDRNLKNRDKMIEAIRQEIIGPTTNFSSADLISENSTEEAINAGKFYYYKLHGSEEEIFTDIIPSRKYAAGLLYPRELLDSNQELEEEYDVSLKDLSDDQQDNEFVHEVEHSSQKPYRKSTMGYTFALPHEVEDAKVTFSCGVYKKINDFNYSVQKGAGWWFRKSLGLEIIVDLEDSQSIQKKEFNLFDKAGNVNQPHRVKLYTTVRNVKTIKENNKIKIVTLLFENISPPSIEEEETILFQCESSVEIEENLSFLNYPNASDLEAEIPEEDKKFELLYLNESNYAFGHDCSVTWFENKIGKVNQIHTTFLPEYEITTITPDIHIDGEKVEIRHSELAAASSFEEMKNLLVPLINGYKNWACALKQQSVNPYYESVKLANLQEIQRCIDRLQKGLELLKSPDIFNCFRLTNLAMLMQMSNGKQKRIISVNEQNIEFDAHYEDEFDTLDYSNIIALADSLQNKINKSQHNSPWSKYKWRGFQIAFLIQSIESIVNKNSIDRDLVDLIWFPTGGGKTEAYLGLAAFSMLYRRLKNPEDIGVEIMMRYTLRLLTADQFQRSARLVCSLEYLRMRFPKVLGKTEYSIGLWVGSSTTPNKNTQAKIDYLDILNNKRTPFIVEGCPWCGAEIKPIEMHDEKVVYSGIRYSNKLEVHCPDKNCKFHGSLPIYFVDEQLYKNPPSFLIGTIDKFVQLTWIPEARSLFGIDKDGKRKYSPPNVIIQDELHLISGPLGTLTGMYEVLVDELTTDYRSGNPVRAKVIGATATIKAYQEQIHSIFGRKKSALFPPSGLDINDNFFSTVLYDEETGKKAPGRKYVGVFTTTQGKLQSQVQTMSALIQKTSELLEDERDPFWTILSFYNSLRDIGTAINLFEQDIPNNISHYYKQRNIKGGRKLRRDGIKELTSRMASYSVSKSISDLKVPYDSKISRPIDVCLASNIIEVGVDIDRLSLMTIVGQPKTTSQYIQVSGRVGRRTEERPGLVVVIYNPNNSIDKSHYEHFNEYHQKLYAQVEVSSVTPFSNFAIKRGLPAALIGYIRQNFSYNRLGIRPDREELQKSSNEISLYIKKILKRAKEIDHDNSETEKNIRNEAYNILEKLMIHGYEDWKWTTKKSGFMVPMTKDSLEIPDSVEPVIFSMRSVDSPARLELMRISSENPVKEGGFSF